MQEHSFADSDRHPAVVVGIDGSRAAMNAALWAVDEAIDRDVPLRLIYVVEPRVDADLDDMARDLANGQIVLQGVLVAVESTNKPVKVELELLQGSPAQRLREASGSAAVVCVGAIGLRGAVGSRVGSTAATLASTSHCPVAVIRSHDPLHRQPGAVVVEVDLTSGPDADIVLQRGIDEAILRGVAVQAVATWRPTVPDMYGIRGVAARDRQVRADLERHLSRWRRRNPEVEITAVAVRGTLSRYLAAHAGPTQLVVVGRRRPDGITEMVGPGGHATLSGSDCAVLVCDPCAEL